MTGHVALYLRLSQLPNGRTDGIDAQERQGRAYAAQHWPGLAVRTYTDKGISAADSDVSRDGFDRLRAAMRAGLVSQLWAANQARLSRQTYGNDSWFTVAAELDAAGITEVHTRDDGVLRPGDVLCGIKAVLNNDYVRTLKKGVRARLDANAAIGQPSGVKPFGYVHAMGVADGRAVKTYAVVPEQAKAVRVAAERVLAGWSLSSIAQALSADGVVSQFRRKIKDAAGNDVLGTDGLPVTRECPISAVSVRSWLTHPAAAGLRMHQGQIIGRGNWEPILDESTWRACQAKLSAPRTVTRPDGSAQAVSGKRARSGRRYTLTGGLAVCGTCGAPLIAALQQRRNRKGEQRPSVASYLCHPSAGGKSCVGISAEGLEQYVAAQLFARLATPGFAAAMAADDYAARRDAITTELAALDAQRAELAVMWASRELTGDEWRLAKGTLAERQQLLTGELAAIPAAPMVAGMADLADSWGDMTLGERREALRLAISAVTVSKARPGANAFDPSRVAITWRAAE